MGRIRITRRREDLSQAIEQLGVLREQIAQREATERDLSGRVRAGMAALGIDTAESPGYLATLATSSSLTIDTETFRRKVDEAVFMACARIDIKTARLHVEQAALERMGTLATSTRLRISARAAAAVAG
jgi:hypothetical protein